MAGNTGPPTVVVGGPKKFRPRPIDPYRAIPIIIDEPTPTDDSAGSSKATDKSIADGTKSTELSAKQKVGVPPKPTTSIGAIAKFNIPAPISEAETSYFDDVPNNFVVSSAYIRFRGQRDDDYVLSDDVDYELTIEDMKWLDKRNGSTKQATNDGPELTEDLLEQLIDILEKATAREIPVSKERAINFIFPERLKLSVSQTASWADMLGEVHDYWMTRRQHANKPLLRRFWPVTAADDPNPHATFRPREKERYKLRKKRENNIESYEKLKQLEKDFMRVQQVIELVQRRERLGKKKVELLQDQFEEAIYQIVKAPSDPPRTRLVTSIEDVEGPLVLSEDEEEVIEVPTARVDDQSAEREIALKEAQLESLKQSLDQKKNKKMSKKKQREERKRLELEAKQAAKEALREQKKEKRKYKKKKANDNDDDGDGENSKPAQPKIPAELQLPPSFLLPHQVFPDRSLFTVPQPPKLRTIPQPNTWRFQPPRPVAAGVPHSSSWGMHKSQSNVANKLSKRVTKYRCRGRVGRGGRYIIDRIPVEEHTKETQSRNYHWPQYITPEAYLQHGRGIESLVGLPSTDCLDSSAGHGDAGAASGDANKVPERQTTTRASTPVAPIQCFVDPAKPADASTAFKIKTLSTASTARVAQVYAMSDSEDEEVVAFDNPTATALSGFNYIPKFQFIC